MTGVQTCALPICDFHYARTSQEAFGQRLSKDDFAETNDKWDKVVGVVAIILAVCVLLLEYGHAFN